MKGIAAYVLIAFVVISVIFLVVKESNRNNASAETDNLTKQEQVGTAQTIAPEKTTDPAPTETESESTEPVSDNSQGVFDKKIIAYYFHETKRCATCLRIEEFAEQAIEEGFESQIKSGQMEYKAVNVDEPENTHFMKDFQLTNKSVVIAVVENGQTTDFVNLHRVWELNNNRDDFFKYIQSETRAFLDKVL